MTAMLEPNPRPGRELRIGDVGVPYVSSGADVQTLGEAVAFLAFGALGVLVVGAALWAVPVLLWWHV